MNIQQTVSFYESKGNKTLTVQYKLENIYSSFFNKSLDDLVNYGKNCHLKDLLKNLIKLLNDNININEKLEEKGYEHKMILNDKKIYNKKIINCLSYSTLEKFIKILENAFTNNNEFYNFSLGLLDIAKEKIKKDMSKDFKIIKRVINSEWWFEIITEGTNILHYGNSFKNYIKYVIDYEDKEHYELAFPELISSSFIESIEPYTDILMEKISSNIFKSLHLNVDSPFGIYNKMEELAWNIYGQELDYKYINNYHRDEFNKIKEDYEKLCSLYTKEFSEYNVYLSSPLNLKREQTMATFTENNFTQKIIDFKDFKTYNNSFMIKYFQNIDKGIDFPLKNNLDEIINNITPFYKKLGHFLRIFFYKFLSF
jgi:hypothetical protein